MRSQTCLKVRAPVELSAQITHEIVPILSRRETREIVVFRETSHLFRLPTQQASHQTLLRRFHSRDGQPITMEHQHCFFHGAESFDRPADGSVEPRNAEHCEECEPSDSVRHPSTRRTPVTTSGS